jgi:uncharacterized membrane protein
MVNKEIKAQVVNNGQEVKTQVLGYSGPLPQASEFEKYESVLPGAADRIIKLAENQNKHRRFIEKFVVIFDSLKAMGGLISALLIVLAGMFAGVYLIMNNKSAQGLVAIITPLGIVAGAFIWQKQNTERDDEKK